MSRIVILLAAIGGAALAQAQQSFELRPLSRNPALNTIELSMDARLAAVDELEREIEFYEGAPPEDKLRELAALYSGSSLMKHRVRALELLDSRRLSIDARLDRAYFLQRTFNPWDADESFVAIREERAHWAAAHRAHGVFLFDRGGETLDLESIARAQDAFELATQCPDAEFADWLGVAASMVARGDRAGLPRVVVRLRELQPDAIGTLLYGALADWDLGLTRSAQAQFEQVIADLPPAIARYFTDLAEFLDSLRPIELAGVPVKPQAPTGLLQWYIRLLESEIIFGRPELDQLGWRTAPGEAWLLFGRPLEHHYFPPGTWSPGIPIHVEDVFHRVPSLDRWRDFLIEALKPLSSQNGFWIWVVQMGELQMPYVFERPAAFSGWNHNAHAHARVIEPYKHSVPMNLTRFERPAPQAELAVRHVAYRSSAGGSLLECNFALELGRKPPAAGTRVLWRIRDEQDSLRVEESRRVDQLVPRSELLPAWSGPTASARLGRFAAALPPGEYLCELQLLRPDDSPMAGADERLRVAAPSSEFGMSGLLLADSYRRWEGGVPHEFVRHAIEVVPHPEQFALTDGEALHVYYEVYDAELDAGGHAHLDVLYEIFDRASFDPLDVGRAEFARRSSEFRDEITGRSPSGAMVRGSVVDLDGLPPGDYVLAVSVSDRLQRRQLHRSVRFSLAAKPAN